MACARRYRGWLLALVLLGSAILSAHPARARAATLHAGTIGGIVTPAGTSTSSAQTGPVLPLDTLMGNDGAPSTQCGNCDPPVLYWGGPVLHSVTTEVVEWLPSGYSYPAGYVNGVEQFLDDLSAASNDTNNDTGVVAQYVDSDGPALSSGPNPISNAAPLLDTDPYPVSGGCTVYGTTVCLTDAQIVDELDSYLQANGDPMGLTHSYIMLLPPNVDSCTDTTNQACEAESYCAYHSDFYSSSTPYQPYTVLPYPASTYSNAQGLCYMTTGPATQSYALAGAANSLMHETLETVTDPVVGAGYLDPDNNEVADECAWTWGNTQTASGGGDYNQTLNGDQYLIQEMWSDADGDCVQQAPSSPPKVEVTLTNGNPDQGVPAGLAATLSNDGSSGEVYRWGYWAPDGSFFYAPAQSSPTAEIDFPASGDYTVMVMVSDSSGATVIGTEPVTVGNPPPSGSFSCTTKSGWAAGTPMTCSFHGAGGAGEQVTAYSWSFGDGGSGNTATVTHTYAHPGSYTVSLKVTQSDGQSTSGAETITVVSASKGHSGGKGSGKKGSGKKGSGHGTKSGPTMTAANTNAHLIALLRSAVRAPFHSGAVWTSLLDGGWRDSFGSFRTRGRLTVDWYTQHGRHRTLVAVGTAATRPSAVVTLVLHLTGAGRAALHRSSTLNVVATDSFTCSVSAATGTTHFTLQRG